MYYFILYIDISLYSGPKENEEITKKWKYLRVNNIKKRQIKWCSIGGSTPIILFVSTTGGYYTVCCICQLFLFQQKNMEKIHRFDAISQTTDMNTCNTPGNCPISPTNWHLSKWCFFFPRFWWDMLRSLLVPWRVQASATRNSKQAFAQHSSSSTRNQPAVIWLHYTRFLKL